MCLSPSISPYHTEAYFTLARNAIYSGEVPRGIKTVLIASNKDTLQEFTYRGRIWTSTFQIVGLRATLGKFFDSFTATIIRNFWNDESFLTTLSTSIWGEDPLPHTQPADTFYTVLGVMRPLERARWGTSVFYPAFLAFHAQTTRVTMPQLFANYTTWTFLMSHARSAARRIDASKEFDARRGYRDDIKTLRTLEICLRKIPSPLQEEKQSVLTSELSIRLLQGQTSWTRQTTSASVLEEGELLEERVLATDTTLVIPPLQDDKPLVLTADLFLHLLLEEHFRRQTTPVEGEELSEVIAALDDSTPAGPTCDSISEELPLTVVTNTSTVTARMSPTKESTRSRSSHKENVPMVIAEQ